MATVTREAVLSETDVDGRRFIGKIIVLSKSAAERFRCEKPWVGISISTYKMFAQVNPANRISLLQLAFPDIDLPRQGWDVFSYAQAHEVYNFIDQFWDVSEVVMCHCEAGLSRSAAIAAALHKVYIGGDNDLYWKRYRPNSRVYSTMLKTAVERGKWDPTADPDRPHVQRDLPDPAAARLVPEDCDEDD